MDNYYKDILKQLEFSQQKLDMGLEATKHDLERCFEEFKVLALRVEDLRDSQMTCQARNSYDRLDARVQELESSLQGTFETALEVTKQFAVDKRAGRTTSSTSLPIVEVKSLLFKNVPWLLTGALLGIGLIGYLLGVGFGLFK